MHKEAQSLAILEPMSNKYVKPVAALEVTETLETIASKMSALNSSQIALVIIMLDFEQSGEMGSTSSKLACRSAYYYLEHLRAQVRKTDSVFLRKHTCYFILSGATLQGGEIVQERLWDALLWRINSTPEGGYLRPHKIVIGHSACSAPFIDAYQCINRASEPMRSFDLQPEEPTPVIDVAEDEELPELARKLGVPYVAYLPRKLSARLQRVVAPRLALELRCFPIGRDRDILTVAMSNPQDHCVLDRLRKETGLNIFPVLAHPLELQTVLEQFS
jgi:Type II secretion system (T2SS), protein E, N-terminal domain